MIMQRMLPDKNNIEVSRKVNNRKINRKNEAKKD